MKESLEMVKNNATSQVQLMGTDMSVGEPASIHFHHWGYCHASRSEYAVRDLTLDIRKSERVLLLGASGIGKSTILGAVAGIVGASRTGDKERRETVSVDEDGGKTEGYIEIGEQTARAARGRTGLVLQDPDSQAILQRVGDNVAFGAENLGVEREEIWQRVDNSMAAVGLSDMELYRSTMHLSGGQMQRLALAGALTMKPGVLLLDEPTANLDPEGVEEVVDSVAQILQANHATLLLVEHRAEPWLSCIDRVIVLGKTERQSADGEGTDVVTTVIADGSPDEVFTDSRIDFSALGVWVPQQYQQYHNDDRAFYEEVHEMLLSGSGDGDINNCAVHNTSHDGDVLLSTKDLAIGRAGNAIARNINVTFRRGEITALLGMNGAGKSTLSLTLAGLLEPVEGEVVASPALRASSLMKDDKELSQSNPYGWNSKQLASRISYVFQNPEHQFAKATVLDEVMLGPIRFGIAESEARKRAESLLERFHLAQYAKANPYTLSGGEKRRLTVAAALACAPQVLLLDEPTFGQDRTTWKQIVRLIASLQRDGVAIIIVTHDAELVDVLQARVVRLLASEGDTGDTANGGMAGVVVEDSVNLAEIEANGEKVSSDLSSISVLPSQSATANSDDSIADASSSNLLQISASSLSTPSSSAPDSSSHSPSSPVSPASPEVCTARTRHRHAATTTITVSSMHERVEPPKSSSRSWYLATLNPAYRFLGALVATLPILITLDVVSAGTMLALEFVLFACIGINPWRLIRSSWPVWIGAPGSCLAVLLYGKSGGTVYWSFGIIEVTERSGMLALATFLRVLAIGIPSIVVILGVDTTDLADSFSQVLHLPDRFVYGGLAGMRLFAVIRDDWSALTASRRSRGLGDDNKIVALFPQIFALLVLSIRRSTSLAVAMEARGFGAPIRRTYARISKVHSRDYRFLVYCFLVPLVSISLSVYLGTFAFFGG